MTEFTASNGIPVIKKEWGYCLTTGMDLGVMTGVSNSQFDALREYFQAERDRELGRWRSKKDPNFIVVPDNLKYEVTVIDEQSGMKQWVTRGGGDGAERSFVVIAEEYFAEHPEKKPWHDASPGEVWVITTENVSDEVAVQRTDTGDWGYNDGRVFRDNELKIETARRIWPESKES